MIASVEEENNGENIRSKVNQNVCLRRTNKCRYYNEVKTIVAARSYRENDKW